MKKRLSYLVLGLGESGRAAYRFLMERGERVVAYDDHVDLAEVTQVRIPPSDIDQVIVSPGFPPTHEIYRTVWARGIPIVSEAELGLRHISALTIGVTGTNGKTTTCRLLEHVLRVAGRQALAVGNVGVPITSQVDRLDRDAIAIVELSSFQLEAMREPLLDIAVILNITPDHLDRHGSLANYQAAKWRIINLVKPGGALFSDPQALPTPRPSCRVVELGGGAAQAICHELGLAGAEFAKAAATFVPPRHRLQPVGECGGVSFVDDSKGTNSAAVRNAVASVPGPITLIAGGQAEGVDFASWIPWLQGKVALICAIGESADQIVSRLGNVLPIRRCTNLAEAVKVGLQSTPKGGTVLLSPGGKSFDQYSNYVERGMAFQKAVQEVLG